MRFGLFFSLVFFSATLVYESLINLDQGKNFWVTQKIWAQAGRFFGFSNFFIQMKDVFHIIKIYNFYQTKNLPKFVNLILI